MKTLLLVCLAGLLLAGCASFQTEIIQDPGRVDSLTVGQFTTRDPVKGELIASYLRKELLDRGFVVSDDSPYIISGTVDYDYDYSDRPMWIRKAIVSLNGYITWRCDIDIMGEEDFAGYVAKQISATLKE